MLRARDKFQVVVETKNVRESRRLEQSVQLGLREMPLSAMTSRSARSACGRAFSPGLAAGPWSARIEDCPFGIKP